MVILQLACWFLGLSGVGGQIPDTRRDWPMVPRWQPGLELVYRGTVEEQSTTPGVMFKRTYTLETRLLVVDVQRGLSRCAFLTRLASGPSDQASVRLELMDVEALGRLMNPIPASPPGEGPATWEHGFLVEVPKQALSDRTRWQTADLGLPLKHWEVIGPEPVAGIPCVKLRAVQESEDWKAPRADHAGWQLVEHVWISSRTGAAQKVQRVVQRRSPARQEPDYCLTTTYDLESMLVYDGTFLAQRRRDAEQVADLAVRLRAMKDSVRKPGAAEWKSLLERIDHVAKLPAATPYREAVGSLRALTVAASENRLPVPSSEEVVAGRLTVGHPAPAFVIPPSGSEPTVTLQQWRGKTVLMVFFLPQSERAAELLLHLEGMQQEYKHKDFLGVALSMNDDKAGMDRLKKNLGLTVPVHAGKALRHSYEVSTTPRFVLLDNQGRVLFQAVGWGPETVYQLAQAVRRACSMQK
jgi:hypothetical protein